jgi:hypothetical protein
LNHLPPSPSNNIRVIPNFLKICGDICKSRCSTGITNTGGKFATDINDTGSKVVTGTPGVVDTGGKLPPVSTILVVKIGTKSDILKWTWRKNYLYVNSPTPTVLKIFKIFPIEDFFYLPSVSMTPEMNLEQWITTWIFRKIWNGLGETEKIPSQ